jgi:hypothetical protein
VLLAASFSRKWIVMASEPKFPLVFDYRSGFEHDHLSEDTHVMA